ncbi:MAG: hypothetical protein WKG07_23575 [Hymenobacter sp.]
MPAAAGRLHAHRRLAHRAADEQTRACSISPWTITCGDYPDFEPFQRLRMQGIQYLTMACCWRNGAPDGLPHAGRCRRAGLQRGRRSAAGKDSLAGSRGRPPTRWLLRRLPAASRSARSSSTSRNALLSIKQREPLFRAIAEELGRVVAVRLLRHSGAAGWGSGAPTKALRSLPGRTRT